MKTVQRLPRSTGALALDARHRRRRCTSMFIETAKRLDEASRSPTEQASLSMMCSITPSLTRRHFMSWPPMSRMNSTPGRNCLGAAQVCNGLDLAGIGLEGLDEQCLAVARGSHVADSAAGGACGRTKSRHDDLAAVPRMSPLLLPYQVCSSSTVLAHERRPSCVVEPASMPMNTRPRVAVEACPWGRPSVSWRPLNSAKSSFALAKSGSRRSTSAALRCRPGHGDGPDELRRT